MRLPKSLYISCAMNNFSGREIEILTGFGRVGSSEIFFVNYDQLLRKVFSWVKKIRIL